MISWLNGKIIDKWDNGLKQGIVLACGNIGYEIQLLPRHLLNIDQSKTTSLWIHQLFRDDGIIMFGFSNKIERNFFRKIIEVNGIGPQIAISLLEEYEYNDLTLAIKTEDIRKLTTVTGVGRRIAERLTIELRGKLSDFEKPDPAQIPNDNSGIRNLLLNNSQRSDLSNILKDIGFKDSEINHALDAIGADILSEDEFKNNLVPASQNKLLDAYLKKALVLLSQDVS